MRLRRFPMLLVASLAIVAAAFAPTPGRAQTPPAVNRPAVAAPASGPILADPPGVDFGVVRPETVVETKIRLINPLDRPVTITRAIPSCQCTTIDMQGKTIPARGSLEMPMSMKTAKSVGKRSANISLAFGGLTQVLMVTIECEVALPIRAEPPFLDALAPERMRGTFTLAAQDGRPFRVLSVDGKPPVAVGGEAGDRAPKERVTLAYDLTVGPVPKYLVVETDRDDCPLVDLRVRHETTRISPPFKVGEFRSTAGRIRPGGRGTFELEIKNMGAGRPVTVRSLSPDATVTLVGQKPDPANVLLEVEVAPRAGFEGLLAFPVEIVAGGQRYEHLVYASVR